MSLFSSELTALLERLQMPQRIAAQAAGIQAPLFNGYCRGRHRPSPENLERICRIFDQADRADLIIAHLHDETPPSAADLVRIKSDTEGLAVRENPAEDDVFRGLTKKVSEAFKFLIRKAREDVEIQEWITRTVAILRGG